jgi:hypothetical protein
LEFVEEIENNTRTGFYVTNIPKGILKRFKKLCKENYGDIYWVGISELLDIKQKYDEMSSVLFSIQKEIQELKQSIKPERRLKTFGE